MLEQTVRTDTARLVNKRETSFQADTVFNIQYEMQYGSVFYLQELLLVFWPVGGNLEAQQHCTVS